MTVRLASPADLPLIPEIERRAGELFRTVGMDAVADDGDPSVDELMAPQQLGRLWVAEESGEIVGYLRLEMVDDAAHIEQVSVLPAFGRRGIGRQLIEAADAWAAARSMRALSLTTFTDVPWNGPYYRRLGFRELRPSEMGPALRRIRAHEAARGLDRWPRTAMRREIAPHG
jgi:GNAT superfamily N-acetyltransferase